MEIVYFVLGVVTVLLVLGVVVIVRVGTQVKKLEEEVQHLQRGSNDVANDLHNRIDNDVHRRIDNEVRDLQLQFKDALDFIGDTKDVLHKRLDDEIREVHSTILQTHNRIDTEVKDILSMVDSRLDKLENKIKQKDLLKG